MIILSPWDSPEMAADLRRERCPLAVAIRGAARAAQPEAIRPQRGRDMLVSIADAEQPSALPRRVANFAFEVGEPRRVGAAADRIAW